MNKKGFTILELVLYIALIAIILTSVTYFAWDIIYGGVKTFAIREVQQNARFAIERMSFEIRKSQGVVSVATDVIVLDNGTDPDVTLRFKEPENKITLQFGADPEQDLTTDEIEVTNGVFTNLEYTYPGSSTPATENIKMEMDFNYYNPQNLEQWLAEEHFQTSVEIKGN